MLRMAIAALAVASLARGQVVHGTAAESRAEYERQLLRVQGLEPIGHISWQLRGNAERVLDGGWDERRALLDAHPDTRAVVRLLASERATEQWLSAANGFPWLAVGFIESEPELESFLDGLGIQSLRRVNVPLDRLERQELQRWIQQQVRWRHALVDHAREAGIWEAVDLASEAPSVIVPDGPSVSDSVARLLGMALSMRLDAAIERDEPEEVRDAINALRRWAEVRCIWPSREPGHSTIESAAYAHLVRHRIYDAVRRRAWTDRCLVAAAEALREPVQFRLEPLILLQHAEALAELEGLPADAARLREFHQDHELEARITAMIEHSDPARSEIVTFTQARLDARRSFEERDEAAAREAMEVLDAFLTRQRDDRDSPIGMLRTHVGMVFVASDTIAEGIKTAEAAWSASEVLVACERARRKWGRWPRDLEEITPRLLPKIPRDPHSPSGAPLRYRMNNDGTFTLWSVGPDGEDNGGRADPSNTTRFEDGFDLVLWPWE